jgi:hypothetical protein
VLPRRPTANVQELFARAPESSFVWPDGMHRNQGHKVAKKDTCHFDRVLQLGVPSASCYAFQAQHRMMTATSSHPPMDPSVGLQGFASLHKLRGRLCSPHKSCLAVCHPFKRASPWAEDAGCRTCSCCAALRPPDELLCGFIIFSHGKAFRLLYCSICCANGKLRSAPDCGMNADLWPAGGWHIPQDIAGRR